MKVGLLTPNIERRLSTLININERKKFNDKKLRPTITLSREYGCEAFPLANLLKETLEKQTGQNWTIYDKGLIKEISSTENLSESFLSHIGDSSRFLDFMASFNRDAYTHTEAYEKMAKHIAKIALEGNAIIIGRGASLITREFDNCLHFRLEAPFPKRVASIAQRLSMSIPEATDHVVKMQTEREKFIADFFHKDIRDIKYYDAIFNDERLTSEQMVQFIEILLQGKLTAKTKTSFAA